MNKKLEINETVLEELKTSMTQVENLKFKLGELDIQLIENERERENLEKERSSVRTIAQNKIKSINDIKDSITKEYGPVYLDIDTGKLTPLTSTD